MTSAAARILRSADGRRRVLIEAGADGLFRFVEQARYDGPPGDTGDRGASLSGFGSLCGSAETAEREARTAVAWLRAEGSSEPG